VLQGYDLCVTGESLRAAEAADEKIWTVTEHVSIYARMAPEDKVRVGSNEG
jgi:magnesium-transporting ATPase (P-type)